MRVQEIKNTKLRVSQAIQTYESHDISAQVGSTPVILRESLKRRALRAVAPTTLRFSHRSVSHRAGVQLAGTGISSDQVSIGERFANDASLSTLLRLMRAEKPETPQNVLVPGCYLGGEDVQFWLRRGARHVEGIDVYSLQERWNEVVPRLEREFGAQVNFQQASIEAMPFADGSFDLVVTNAVMEHVRNLEAATGECARVLRPGGWVWHNFGPLYFTWNGDHCMDVFGEAAGYDHLLLDEKAYQQRLADQKFFDATPDPNKPFWARHDQFSFATATEYFAIFKRYFDIAHVVIKYSEDGLSFRDAHPKRWEELKSLVALHGLNEADLLIKGVAIVLRKLQSP